MKATSKMIAIATIAISAGAFALPAAADFGDFGQHVYTDQNPSRFAPQGLDTKRKVVRQSNRGFSVGQQRQAIYDRLDRQHKAY